MVWYDYRDKPFRLFGLMFDQGKLCRMPEASAAQVSQNVLHYHNHTTGGRLAFRTNSQKITLSVELKNITRCANLCNNATAGFDLYEQNRHLKTFFTPRVLEEEYESSVTLPTKQFRNLVLYFPLYSGISALRIGLDYDAVVEPYDPYKNASPIVYYGPSYTHGGAASRPGNIYQSKVSRDMNMDFINLGMDGSALGETAMAEYIAGLDMGVFIMDYDANAPDAAHLEKTHEPFFKIIRDKQPELPVIFMTRPCYREDTDAYARRDVIYRTYIHAKQAGDHNVYFIDSAGYFRGTDHDFCFTDGIHPNDYGFFIIGSHITALLKDILHET